MSRTILSGGLRPVAHVGVCDLVADGINPMNGNARMLL